MIRAIKYLTLAIILVAFGEVANAQRNPNMKVSLVASPSNEISIAPLTPENVPEIDKAKLANVHPSAFILTNLSNRAIVALAVEWVYTTPDGRTANGFHKSDSFLFPSARAIVQPHAKLFVGPQVFVPEASASPYIGSQFASLDGSYAPWSMNTMQITAAVDVVVFEDGELVGPNKSEYDIELNVRKLAADQIASKVRYAQSKGENPIDSLNAVARTPVSGPKDFVTQWSAFFAQRLIKSQQFDAQLKAIENTPAPPQFFRKTE